MFLRYAQIGKHKRIYFHFQIQIFKHLICFFDPFSDIIQHIHEIKKRHFCALLCFRSYKALFFHLVMRDKTDPLKISGFYILIGLDQLRDQVRTSGVILHRYVCQLIQQRLLDNLERPPIVHFFHSFFNALYGQLIVSTKQLMQTHIFLCRID